MFVFQRVLLFFLIFTFIYPFSIHSWGFLGHRTINRIAVFCLPPEMSIFFKKHIDYITDNAVAPDKRRHLDEEEAPRHYIDLNEYGDSASVILPKNWNRAVEKYTEEALKKHGIVPWHIIFMKYQLTNAFQKKDMKRILRISADIGHYIADANVPLHTTSNYNGQLTGQLGIHGFWESRIPELFLEDYDFFVGKAVYIPNVETEVWKCIFQTHSMVDSVLSFEKILSQQFPPDEKMEIVARGNTMVQTYSYDYSKKYQNVLNGQIERQLRRSIQMVSNIWYTAWIDAGQPTLDNFIIQKENNILEVTDTTKNKNQLQIREHE
ncbi:MAG: zinc dependent phospholipase C family protein [Chitinophagaceae bacterium]|nr:zinc dependent phospholipase C family protein [Chitinophagaceae bacterium]